jgi:hypothetical protein
MLLLHRVRELVARRKATRRLGPGVPDPLPAPSVPRPASPRELAHAALPARDLQELEAQARYHRERVGVLSAKPASAARLRELQRTSPAADARLRHAAMASRNGDQHGPL